MKGMEISLADFKKDNDQNISFSPITPILCYIAIGAVVAGA